MRRITVLNVVVVIVFRCHASEKLQEALFLEAELEIFLALLIFQVCYFSVTIFGEVMFQLIKIN